MTATCVQKQTVTNYTFNVELDGRVYQAVVYLNDDQKFIDDQVTRDGILLEYEGEEGETREQILDYIDENWERLVL
jgi:hypothetical protein